MFFWRMKDLSAVQKTPSMLEKTRACKLQRMIFLIHTLDTESQFTSAVRPIAVTKQRKH